METFGKAFIESMKNSERLNNLPSVSIARGQTQDSYLILIQHHLKHLAHCAISEFLFY